MIDIKQIRENPERFKKAAKDKFFDVDIDRLLEVDGILREKKKDLQDLLTEKNTIGKFISKLELDGDEKQAQLKKLSELKLIR